MVNVFDYLDYRAFLGAWYKEAKAVRKGLSYRTIASRVGYASPGFFTQILQGKTNISLETATGFADLVELKGRPREYFLALVSWNQSKDPDELRRSHAKLQRFLDFKVRELKAEQERFLESWHHAAIREILGMEPYRGDADRLAALLDPPITRRMAEESIELLISLGLAARTSRGVERRDPSLSAGTAFPEMVTGRFFRELHGLGIRAMDHYERPRRSMSWVTFSASPAALAEILEEARAFRRKVLEIASRDARPTGVHQLTLMVHPLSRELPEAAGK
jgi:uncharacterized protein (TIGR02147 family)